MGVLMPRLAITTRDGASSEVEGMAGLSVMEVRRSMLVMVLNDWVIDTKLAFA